MLKKSLLPMLLLLVLAAVLPQPARADDMRWTLVLAWSPQYCKSHGNPHEPQCVDRALFVPAALIPQQVDGSTCVTDVALSSTEVDRLSALTQNAREARQLWRSLGGCAGSSLDEYVTQFDYASRRVVVPEVYSELSRSVSVSPAEIRDQFVQANDGLPAEAIALHCKNAELVDVTFCLTQKMKFSQCGARVVDSCTQRKVQIRAPGR